MTENNAKTFELDGITYERKDSGYCFRDNARIRAEVWPPSASSTPARPRRPPRPARSRAPGRTSTRPLTSTATTT